MGLFIKGDQMGWHIFLFVCLVHLFKGFSTLSLYIPLLILSFDAVVHKDLNYVQVIFNKSL